LVRTIVIYATTPVGNVVGEFDVGGVLREKPGVLWNCTKEAAGITRAFFDTYFDGRDEAIAIAVTKPKRYTKPKSLKDVSGSSAPPQSLQYLAAEAKV
jgi:predicted transcriptional regulator